MRTLTALLAAAFALAGFAPGAGAKGIASATVCGAAGCKDLGRSQAHHRLFEGGEPSFPPERAAPYFVVRMKVGADGHYERVRAYYVPSARLVGFEIADHPVQWSRTGSRSEAAFGDAARGLRPFPARGLRRFVQAPRADGGVVGVYTGSGEPSPAGGGDFPWPASGIGIAAALAAAGLALARRRRPAGQ